MAQTKRAKNALNVVFPVCFGSIYHVVDHAGEHKEIIGKAIEVYDDVVVYGAMGMEGNGVPFGAAANIASHMQGCRARVTAG